MLDAIYALQEVGNEFHDFSFKKYKDGKKEGGGKATEQTKRQQTGRIF